MANSRIRIEAGWKSQLQHQFKQPYMVQLRAHLLDRANQGAVIYPKAAQWFSAFNQTPFDQVRVVILGQDPYHGPGQAHGMCFSVLPGVAIPPSLRNIYKELQADLGIEPVTHGYLEAWATQGVFLLNSVLTVEHGQAASHQGLGWEQFTDAVIQCVSDNTSNTVFMLWGGYAKRKGQIIDSHKHCVLSCAHPSPLSVRGFTGCKHFSKANEYLQQHGRQGIDWQLPQHVSA
ncbi:uracil-DNA glycosylase [Chromatiales bacterium (ex Bugula neritina AB1)]|nr:uracil-DNA glycosylase [Chromatiales bacterium (ex Bugula neritina AB1)]